jgi:hypothetical protein
MKAMWISQGMRDIGLKVNDNIVSRFPLSSPILDADMPFYLHRRVRSGLLFIPQIGLSGTP